MKRLAVITLFSVFLAALSMNGLAGAANHGDRKSIIIMFHDPVTREDLEYLEAIGGVIKCTYSIFNGVAVDLPVTAADKLWVIYQYPSSPLSDSIAKNISFIEDDDTVYAFSDITNAAGETAVASQPLTESSHPGTTDSIRTAFGFLPGNIFMFPVLPLTVHL